MHYFVMDNKNAKLFQISFKIYLQLDFSKNNEISICNIVNFIKRRHQTYQKHVTGLN